MKKALFLLAIGLIVSMTACGNAQKESSSATQQTTVAVTKQPQTTAPAGTETTRGKASQNEQPMTEEESIIEEQTQEQQEMTLQMTIGATPVTVAWEDNEAVEALKELCRNEPLTISMSMYGSFEQVGSIGAELPANDVQTTTSAGDIVLYSGDQMVVFYGSNSWAYTRLGHITDQNADGMEQLLSNGDTTITIDLG